VVSALCFVSFVLTLFVLVTYVLTPEKRGFPQVIILCISINLIFWFLPMIIGLKSRSAIECINLITPSSPGNNLNPLCVLNCEHPLFNEKHAKPNQTQTATNSRPWCSLLQPSCQCMAFYQGCFGTFSL